MARAEAGINSQTLKVERLPFSHIPLPHERQINAHDVGVAAHELRHALVAENKRVPILSISIIPDSTSLGRTILAGDVGLEDLKDIAAGGAVSTHLGAAEGYGSDLFKAELLAHYYGGKTVGEAIHSAEGIVNSHSRKVLQYAAEILASLGRISGTELPSIMARAAIEVDIEEGRDDFFIAEELINIESPEIPEEITVVEDVDQTVSRIKKIEDGEVQEEFLLCNLCRRVNGHFANCPILVPLDETA